MNTSVQLDYQTILANSPQPVHLAFQFTAPATTVHRDRPIAFSLVVDRSGSMQGPPLAAAIRAAKAVVKNLRKEDWFSLVVFNDTANVVIPLAQNLAKEKACRMIEAIPSDGYTNLTGGWMLGRDELKGTPQGTVRRQLLLTDGLTNRGITEPHQIKQIVGDGLERDGIRTSTLGFGDSYDENLLADLAKTTGGEFYDANEADKLPAIFQAELDGLQKITIQNLRIRLKLLDFVEESSSLGGYNSVSLPDGRTEFAIGDLVAEEERIAVFALSVLPMPLQAGSTEPAATLEGESLVDAEILYDEITPEGVSSHAERHLIRVRPTQASADIQVNRQVLPWISAQQAAQILTKALAIRDDGDHDGAKAHLEQGIARLKAYGAPAEVADGITLLENSLRDLVDPRQYMRSRKSMVSKSASFMRMSSASHWASNDASPSFLRKAPPSPATPPPANGNPGINDPV